MKIGEKEGSRSMQMAEMNGNKNGNWKDELTVKPKKPVSQTHSLEEEPHAP